MLARSRSPGFWVVFTGLALLAVLPIASVDYLPLVDLPQHAAQVSTLLQWHDPACGYPQVYDINWFTPYWLGYGLALCVSAVTGVAAGFQILLAALVVATALATRALVVELGGDEWWALLVLPLAYGSAMSWGFYSFLVSLPIALLLLRSTYRYLLRPAVAHGLRLGAGIALLFVAHALTMVVFFALAVVLTASTTRSVRRTIHLVAPMALALPLPVAWLLLTLSREGGKHATNLYHFGWSRLVELPVLITGTPWRSWAFGSIVAVAVGIWSTRPRPAREIRRWVPAAVIVAIVLGAPLMYFGTAYLAPRFAPLLLPAILCGLERSPDSRQSWARRLPVVLVTAVLLAVVLVRFQGMDREAAGLREVLEEAPPGGRLLYLDFDRRSRYSPDPAFLHFGSWYAVGRCGVADLSFARNFPSPVRYRAGVPPPIPWRIEYQPFRFRWEEHGGERFDLFLLRAARKPNPMRLAGRDGRLELLANRGMWWLFRNVRQQGGAGVDVLEGTATITR